MCIRDSHEGLGVDEVGVHEAGVEHPGKEREAQRVGAGPRGRRRGGERYFLPAVVGGYRLLAPAKQGGVCLLYTSSIHALREEGDVIEEGGHRFFAISIHALREEGDSKNRDKISIFKQIIQHSARI